MNPPKCWKALLQGLLRMKSTGTPRQTSTAPAAAQMATALPGPGNRELIFSTFIHCCQVPRCQPQGKGTLWLPCKPLGRSIVFTSSSAMSKAFSPLSFFSQKSCIQSRWLLVVIGTTRNGTDSSTKSLLAVQRGNSSAGDSLLWIYHRRDPGTIFTTSQPHNSSLPICCLGNLFSSRAWYFHCLLTFSCKPTVWDSLFYTLFLSYISHRKLRNARPVFKVKYYFLPVQQFGPFSHVWSFTRFWDMGSPWV